MSLDALAPDQRAVVQLVLQQGRSYADLAGLLQISEDAVRERAQRGLAQVADPGDLDATEQGEVVDYLLGQGSVPAREATRSLLRSDPAHHAWASALAAELATLPGARLPDVPEPVVRRRRAAAPAAEPAAPADAGESVVPEDAVAAGADPTLPGIAPPEDLGTAASGVTTPEPEGDDAPAVRARPRPARATPPAAAGADDLGDERGAAPDAPRSSRLGGALLIGVIALVLVAVVVFALTRGDGDDDTDTASTGTTATATATPGAEATPFEVDGQQLQSVGVLPMAGVPGSDAQGQVQVLLDVQRENDPTLTFLLQATGLDPRQSYAIWLTGGGDPFRVGFVSNEGAKNDVIAANGDLQAIQGPSASTTRGRRDAKQFTERFTTATRMVLSRETTGNARQPGAIVLSADIPKQTAQATATPSP